MDSTKHSDAFVKAQTVLKEVKNKLTELSNTDLSGLHVHHEWSWIPYIKDHLDFLIEQTTGIEEALRDASPPVSDEDIKRMMEKNPQ